MSSKDLLNLSLLLLLVVAGEDLREGSESRRRLSEPTVSANLASRTREPPTLNPSIWMSDMVVCERETAAADVISSGDVETKYPACEFCSRGMLLGDRTSIVPLPGRRLRLCREHGSADRGGTPSAQYYYCLTRVRELLTDSSHLNKMSKPAPPPFGVYVPAVLFYDQNEELDESAVKQHVLRLAEVRLMSSPKRHV